jgi:hypothetical protein
MQLWHTPRATSAVFDDPNLVSSAGLVPVLALARSAGLEELAQQHLSVPTGKGANAGLKVSSLVAGMVAGADSIDDMALLRHGGMGRVFAGAYAPSTLGSFLRAFTFGHVRQLDAVASRFLTRLAAQTPLTSSPDGSGRVMVDIDDTMIEATATPSRALGTATPASGGSTASSQSRPRRTPRRWSWPNACGRDRVAHRAVRSGWSPTH